MVFYNYKMYLSRYMESTQESYLRNVNLYLKFLKEYKGNCDKKTVLSVTKSDIYNYVAYMDNLKKGTKKVRLISVKNYYNFLDLNLSKYLFEDIKLFELEKKLPKILSRNESRALLNYYKSGRNYLIVFLFLNTGIRISELTNILIENINLKDKYIHLKVKGGNYRNVYLNEATTNLLKDYIKNKEGKLFNLERRQVHNIITTPMKELGIKGSTHTLRHTFATEMYEQTKDILVVKELLGHKCIESTEIYTYIRNETLKQAFYSNPLGKWGVEDEN